MKNKIFSTILFALIINLSYAQDAKTVLSGHSDLICGVSFHPGDKQIATTGSWDYTTMIWDINTAKNIHTLTGFSDAQISCTYSHDGKLLITAGSDKKIHVYQTKNWNEMFSFECPATIWYIDISPDNKTLAAGCWDGNIYLFDMKTKKSTKLSGHKDNVNCVNFSPDGNYLVSASEDNTLMIWDIHKQNVTRTLIAHSKSVMICKYSPDGKKILSGSDDNQAILWNAKSGNPIHRFDMPDMVRAVAFSPNGKWLAASGASKDASIRIFDTNTFAELAILKHHNSFVNSMSFSPDNKSLASVSSDKDLVIWNLSKFNISQ